MIIPSCSIKCYATCNNNVSSFISRLYTELGRSNLQIQPKENTRQLGLSVHMSHIASPSLRYTANRPIHSFVHAKRVIRTLDSFTAKHNRGSICKKQQRRIGVCNSYLVSRNLYRSFLSALFLNLFLSSQISRTATKRDYNSFLCQSFKWLCMH